MGKKSSLMTPDPYHIPGYCGYVPQFKYKLGETFGSHTHKLLTDKSVASSSNPVLTNDETPQPPPPKTQADFFSSPVYYDNTRSFGNNRYMPQMVPGYTGYIPKALNHFGSRYAESCHYAISAFKTDQDTYRKKMEGTRRHGHIQSSSAPATPLKPIAQEAKPYLPLYSKQKYSTISPFNMPDGHPQKYFMSGYTGFIPKQQKYMGEGYPIITTKALQEHALECEKLEELMKAPVVLDHPPPVVKQAPLLFKKGQGLLPRYTGHIPGQKYKYGMTFGTSTNRAVSEIVS